MNEPDEPIRPAQNDEELERRIVRRLDGELDGPEAEALQRRLLRDPAAHRLMDEYAAADSAAAEALRAAFGQAEEGPAELWQRLAPRLGRPGRRIRVGLAAAAAVAAAVLVAVGFRPPGGGPAKKPAEVAGMGSTQPVPGSASAAVPELPPEVARMVWRVFGEPEPVSAGGGPGGDVCVPLPPIQGPRRARRAVERRVFTGFDRANNAIYLLGVDRVRTRVRPIGKDL